MSNEFDPYLRWLGIRDPERPPNHYRLLGLHLFESDPEIISEAADRQMMHVRTHQTGQHADLSQKLLNELARAKVCLLNLRRKAAYDEHLKEQIQNTQEATPFPNEIPQFNLAKAQDTGIVMPKKNKANGVGTNFGERGTSNSASGSRVQLILEVIGGPQKGNWFEYTERGTFTVGRSKQAGFALPGDPTLSRIHFAIRVNPPCCFLKNLSETRPTFVNDKPVAETLLRDNDIVTCGKNTRLRVRVTALSEGQSPAAKDGSTSESKV